MEIKMTLEELKAIIDASRDKTEREQRYAAALQGIDVDKGKQDAEVEKVKRRAQAKLKGKSEDEILFGQLGIEYKKE